MLGGGWRVFFKCYFFVLAMTFLSGCAFKTQKPSDADIQGFSRGRLVSLETPPIIVMNSHLNIPIPLFFGGSLIGFVGTNVKPTSCNVEKSIYDWRPVDIIGKEVMRQMASRNRLVDADVREYEIPGFTDRASTKYMDNWSSAFNVWYNSDTPLNLASSDIGRTDHYVLEVVTQSFSWNVGTLSIRIMIKVVDSKKNTIVGRSSRAGITTYWDFSERLAEGPDYDLCKKFSPGSPKFIEYTNELYKRLVSLALDDLGY